jgi:hypothetical protein
LLGVPRGARLLRISLGLLPVFLGVSRCLALEVGRCLAVADGLILAVPGASSPAGGPWLLTLAGLSGMARAASCGSLIRSALRAGPAAA